MRFFPDRSGHIAHYAFGPLFKRLSRQRWKIWGMAGMASLLLGGWAALSAAPYLPRLLEEAYPQLNWPAPGYFARLEGKISKPDPTAQKVVWDSAFPHKSPRLDGWSRKLFEEKEGAALIIWQGGQTRLRHFAKGITPQNHFNAYSMTKSLVGILVLKAVAEGKIASLQVKIGTFWPKLRDPALKSVSLQSLMTMRSGLVSERKYIPPRPGSNISKNLDFMRFNPFGTMVRLHMSGLEDILPGLKVDPAQIGTFSYQNINTAILGAVLEKIYARPLHHLLAEKIWKPAGAGLAHWRQYDAQKPVTPYCCIYARPEDWVKVAVFLMHNGRQKKQDRGFLPEPLWKKLMGSDFSDAELQKGSRYGLHVYHNILDRPGEKLQGRFTYMFGSRGQVVYMLPRQDLVVVRFGRRIQLLHSTLYAASRNLSRWQKPGHISSHIQPSSGNVP